MGTSEALVTNDEKQLVLLDGTIAIGIKQFENVCKFSIRDFLQVFCEVAQHRPEFFLCDTLISITVSCLEEFA